MERDRQDLPLAPETITQALRRGVFSVVGKCHDLEDLVQDAWLSLLSQKDKLARVDEKALPAYIRQIGKSSAIDALRHRHAVKRGGQKTIEALPPTWGVASDVPTPERTTIARDTLRRTLTTAAGPQIQSAQILQLFFLQGLSAEAAAERRGISPNTVYSALRRARLRLAAARPD